MNHLVSIICPTYNEEKYIEECINSILQQDYPQDKMEVLFVDGMSKDETRFIIQKYQEKYPFIKLIDNPRRIVPIAMNIGISQAMGETIIRIDAHSYFPPNYISVLSKNLYCLKAANVGVVCKTDVLNKNAKTLAIKEVLSNSFGVGNSFFRIGTNKIMEVDTVPFGCYNKSTFDKFGYYNERLVRNQDIELNKRIKRAGGKIYLLPDSFCVYYARETFREIAKNNFQNGKWNILTVDITRTFDSLSLRHFIPFIFIMSLLFFSMLSFFYFPLLYLSIASFLLYSILLLYASTKIALRSDNDVLFLIVGFLVLHFSYGFGTMIGLINVICKQIMKNY